MIQNQIDGIWVEDIHKKFGTKSILHGLSFSVPTGSIFGLIGLNGSGKTTLLRILLGLIKPDKGECMVLAMNPKHQLKKYYQQVGVVLEHNGFYGNLTLLENLFFFAEARGIDREQVMAYIANFWTDSTIIDDLRKVKYFSRGQKMQCSLCRAFLGWPPLYFFDEPAVALDIQAYDHFFSLVRHAQSKGATIVISSHQLDAIEELCTTIGILENGIISMVEEVNKGKMNEVWQIKSSFTDEYRCIIEEITATSSPYHNGTWTITIPSEKAKSIISRIISQLVQKGCEIYEVKPQKEGLRKSISHRMQNEKFDNPTAVDHER